LVAEFDRNVREAREALAAATDEDFAVQWSLTHGDRVLMTLSRREIVRQNINHLVHHRGQLSVYLRLLDVPLPPIYGPTADGGFVPSGLRDRPCRGAQRGRIVSAHGYKPRPPRPADRFRRASPTSLARSARRRSRAHGLRCHRGSERSHARPRPFLVRGRSLGDARRAAAVASSRPSTE